MSALVKTDRINFSPQWHALSGITSWVQQQALLNGFDPVVAVRIALTIEEAIAPALHATSQQSRAEMDLICRSVSNEWVEFTLRNKGPALHKRPDLLLMGKHMDEVHYQRHHHYHTLILKKFLTVSSQ